MSNTHLVNIQNFAFPDITVEQGDFVIWRNLDPVPHTVETEPQAERYFNAGPLFTGAMSSPVLFSEPGDWPYICQYHPGMEGMVKVAAPASLPQRAASNVRFTTSADQSDTRKEGHGGHPHHLKHFHGFVTGGRTASRLYMTHTPVLADPRHCFQIILQAHLVKDLHVKAYNEMRATYGAGRVQTFHDHLALPDIASGTIKTLPSAYLVYYPQSADEEVNVPGLDADVEIAIDRVIHFHVFEPDRDYPGGMEYIMYGDDDDVFIDHHITRAPNFHSVAKLEETPDFWKGRNGGPLTVLVKSKRIYDVEPKYLPRVSFVDNAFHLVWLPPSGALTPQDPLKVRHPGNDKPKYEVTFDGGRGAIQIGHFLHFDIRLLNNRVAITP